MFKNIVADDEQLDGLKAWALTTWADIVLYIPTKEKDTHHVTSILVYGGTDTVNPIGKVRLLKAS